MSAPTRADAVTGTLAAELIAGVHGASGECFMTTRALAARFGVSMENACRVMTALCGRRLLRLDGKHFYICTGPVPPESPYGFRLAATRRPMYGFVMRIVDNPFFSSLAARLSEAVRAEGYALHIAVSGSNLAREAEIIDEFIDSGAMGIFACPSVKPGVRELYARCPLPLVVMGQDLHLPGSGTVLVDNQSAGAQVAAHLLAVGCTHFAYVGMENYIRKDPRLRGFAEQLRAAGQTLPGDAVIAAGLREDGSPRMDTLAGPLGNLLRRLPAGGRIGIFCFQDLIAAEVLRIVRHFRMPDGRQIRIPQDAAVAGFDDLPIASSITPHLTTVSYRYESIAAEAAAMMRGLMEAHGRRGGTVMIDSSLSVRESTMVK